MKKFIIPMMLGIVTVGALTSCNNTPTQNFNDTNYNIVEVKRAKEVEKPTARLVTKVNDEDLRGIKNTTAAELGLPTEKITTPTWDDFNNANTFEFMGYQYTVTETDGSTTMKKSAFASDAGTVKTVYAGSVDGCNSFSNYFTSYSSFKEATSLVGVIMMSSDVGNIPKLENIFLGTNCTINNQLKSTIKNLIFTSDPNSISGLKYVSPNTKIIAPASIAANIRKKLDIAFYNDRDYMVENPTLYVIPDEDLCYKSQEFRKQFEVGGTYITASSSGSLSYGISYIGDKATKVVCDLSLFDNERSYSWNFVQRMPDHEKTHVEEMYFKYPITTSQSLFTAFEMDKLYLGNITNELWASNYECAKEVYFPADIDEGFDSVHLNNGEEIALTTYYFPDTEKDNPTLYANVIQELSKNSKAKFDYYDASSYTPTMEVEVNGVRKSTTDMNVSYSELVQEALNSTGEEIGDVNQDEMTEEEREKLARDQEAADPVIASISEIGEVTLESKDVINEVKAAYEELTYDQQQLVTNKEDLVNAITTYNELVAEFNENLEEGQEALQTIADLKDKTKVDDFFEGIKESKALTAVTVLLGTALGGFLIYGLYKLISKFVKWVKR